MVAAESAFGIRGKPFLKSISKEYLSTFVESLIGSTVTATGICASSITNWRYPFFGDDVFSGRRVQLFLYALAAADALKIGRIEEGFYWAILSAKASSLKLSGFMDPQEMDRTATFRALIMEKINSFFKF